jgi:hypothetical protein
MADYIKLTEPPAFVIRYPQCSACMVDLHTDSDDWTCPVCGTSWSMSANDGDEGTLYESWSGETLDGEALTHSQAMSAGIKHELEEREAFLKRLGLSVPSATVRT